MGEANVPLYPTDIEQLCITDIIDAECVVNTEGGTLTVRDIPFSGSVGYEGNVTGEVGYSGEALFNGEVAITKSGTVPFETLALIPGGGAFTYSTTAPTCLEGQNENCCKIIPQDNGFTHLVCFKVPAASIIQNTFNYDICEAKTVDVAWNYEGTAPYSGLVPVSVTLPYSAPYSGTANYSGSVQTEVREFAADDVIYSEGNVQISCPEQNEVPTQTVEFKELVTKAVVGDTINIEATGYSYVGGKTLQQRLVVSYKPTPSSPWTLVARTDKEIITSVAGGQFKDYMDQFTFTNAGTYRILFKVWQKTATGWALKGQAVNRTVTVVEP